MQPCAYFDLIRVLPLRFQTTYLIGILHAAATGVILALLVTLMGQIFDESTNEDEDDYDQYEESRKIALIWLSCSILVVYSGFVSNYCITRVSQQVGRTFRTRFLQAILRRDCAYLDTHSASELTVRLERDGELVEAGTGEKVMIFVEVGAFCLLALAVGFEKSPQVLLVCLTVVPLGLAGNVLTGYGLVVGAQKKEEAYIQAGAISEESLTDIKTVSAFNAQSFISLRYNAALCKSTSVMSKMGTLKGIGWGMTWMGWMLTGVLAFWPAAKWISDERENWIWGDDLEGPDVLVIYWMTVFFFTQIGQQAPGIQAAVKAKQAGGRIFSFLREQPTILSGTQETVLKGNVEFRDVHFAYPTQPDVPILRGLSFTCEQGRKLAIVGESGAGKSTIIQLIEHFYEPSSGQIFFDQLPLAAFDMVFLRKQIGYVGQEPVLFSMSIQDNIHLGKLDATQEEIETAAKEANATDFISQLEKGLLTEVGFKGSKLSGGQKQRIAIARAIIKQPKLLLLDEATSALDNRSEELVLRVLHSIHAKMGMTMISVAQKLSTIREADTIVVLREGKVEEMGSHEALLRRNGLYAQMCNAQTSTPHKETEQQGKVIETETNKLETIAEIKETPQNESKLSVLRQYPVLRIVRSMMTYWPLFLMGTVATVVAGCMFPALGYFVGKAATYISGPSGGTMEQNVRKFAIWMLICSIITLIAYSVAGWAFSLMSSRIVKALREECFWKLLHLDAQYFDSVQQPTLLSHSLNSDAEKTNDAGGPLFSTVLMLFIAYIAVLILGFFWQWQLTVLEAVLIPIEAFCLIRSWVVHLAGPAHPQLRSATALSQDAIPNVKTLRACGAQDEIVERYDQALQSAYKATSREMIYNSLWYGSGVTIIFVGLALSFWFGAYLEKRDEADRWDVNIVSFAACFTVFGMASNALFAPELVEGTRAAGRIYAMIDYQPHIDSLSSTGVTSPILGHIEFKDVGFKYAGRDNTVLQGISLVIAPKQQMGLTGASGSGKSTITQLLLRLYDPVEGSILIDGVEIRNYNVKHLRASMALVGQEPVLFAGSIRANVDFGLQKTDEEIREALKQAAIPKFAEELDRDVGTRGSAISGGQKQRIAIARAILRNPRILLLDEATSALDTHTEAKILRALETAGAGRTVLMVAHRLSTVERCTEIVVLEAGKVVERGTHLQLCTKKGAYARLLKLESQ